MPFYICTLIKLSEDIIFVKNYIKSLLVSIKDLNQAGYVHGDIKPENFIYINSNEFYLIDFNASTRINTENDNMKQATLPYIPPETNRFCGRYLKNVSPKSDLWSVGIILLFFMAERKIFDYKILDQNKIHRRNSLNQYAELYGANKAEILLEEKILLKRYKYNAKLIEAECKRNVQEKKDAIDLIKKFLELDVDKRINIEDALNHNFLKNQYQKKIH